MGPSVYSMIDITSRLCAELKVDRIQGLQVPAYALTSRISLCIRMYVDPGTSQRTHISLSLHHRQKINKTLCRKLTTYFTPNLHTFS